MTATPAPGAPPSTMMTDEEYGALRTSAAVWAGTSVLITDRRGRVLIQHVDYHTTCLLPGGAIDPNEAPARGAARELREELGVTTTVDLLAQLGAVPLPARRPHPGHREVRVGERSLKALRDVNS